MLLGQERLVSTADATTDHFWQHIADVHPSFSQNYFNDDWLQNEQAVVGLAKAGRGNTKLISIAGNELVLRHYKRGGYASKLSENRYLWRGLDSLRPFQELAMLVHLAALKLPVSQPYAAEVVRSGASYSGSLITYRLPGSTLGELFVHDQMTPDLWHQVGQVIALFHQHGVCHADLNAHNILVRRDQDPTADGSIALLDFDRACIKDPNQPEWQHKVVSRLQRSLLKIAAHNQRGLLEIAWQTLLDGVHGKARV